LQTPAIGVAAAVPTVVREALLRSAIEPTKSDEAVAAFRDELYF
jgi:hypothetical protein